MLHFYRFTTAAGGITMFIMALNFFMLQSRGKWWAPLYKIFYVIVSLFAIYVFGRVRERYEISENPDESARKYDLPIQAKKAESESPKAQPKSESPEPHQKKEYESVKNRHALLWRKIRGWVEAGMTPSQVLAQLKEIKFKNPPSIVTLTTIINEGLRKEFEGS